MGRRAVSAAVLAPLALVCIWQGGFAFDGLILIASIGLSIEWVGLCGATSARAPGLFVPAALLLAGLIYLLLSAPAGLTSVAVCFAVLWAVTRQKLLAAGILYVGLPMVCLLWLRGVAQGRESVLFLVLVIWATDIGAYLIGRLLGGPKLAPALSPGKTWSGAAGGLFTGLVAGLFVEPGAGGLALLLGVACQAGDLLESALKRHVGVKDSGRLIPGHGGLLDRLDGLLAAAPVAAIAMLASRGGQW